MIRCHRQKCCCYHWVSVCVYITKKRLNSSYAWNFLLKFSFDVCIKIIILPILYVCNGDTKLFLSPNIHFFFFVMHDRYIDTNIRITVMSICVFVFILFYVCYLFLCWCWFIYEIPEFVDIPLVCLYNVNVCGKRL